MQDPHPPITANPHPHPHPHPRPSILPPTHPTHPPIHPPMGLTTYGATHPATHKATIIRAPINGCKLYLGRVGWVGLGCAALGSVGLTINTNPPHPASRLLRGRCCGSAETIDLHARASITTRSMDELRQLQCMLKFVLGFTHTQPALPPTHTNPPTQGTHSHTHPTTPPQQHMFICSFDAVEPPLRGLQPRASTPHPIHTNATHPTHPTHPIVGPIVRRGRVVVHAPPRSPTKGIHCVICCFLQF